MASEIVCNFHSSYFDCRGFFPVLFKQLLICISLLLLLLLLLL